MSTLHLRVESDGSEGEETNWFGSGWFVAVVLLGAVWESVSISFDAATNIEEITLNVEKHVEIRWKEAVCGYCWGFCLIQCVR